MRLKQQYEIIEAEGKHFAVPLDNAEGDYNGLIRLNGTAEAIFEMLQEETDEETIVEKMCARYNVDAARLAEDVHGIIEKFREKGLLV